MKKNDKQKRLIQSQKSIIPWAIGATLLAPIVLLYAGLANAASGFGTTVYRQEYSMIAVFLAILIPTVLWLLVMSLGTQIKESNQTTNKKKSLWW